jgi:hypothetical protein
MCAGTVYVCIRVQKYVMRRNPMVRMCACTILVHAVNLSGVLGGAFRHLRTY